MNRSQGDRFSRSVRLLSVSNALDLALLLIRTVVLMRLLPIELFGAFATATAIVLLTEVLPNLGLGAALVNRVDETHDEDAAAAVHFTLRLITRSIWAATLIVFGLALTSGPLQTALIVLAIANWARGLTGTALSLCVRRVQHERVAVNRAIINLLSSIAAIILAVRLESIWALLAPSVVGAVISLIAYHLWRPVWRPWLSFDRTRISYFLGYGTTVMGGHLLRQLLENADDLWVRLSFGDVGAGIYSRAYHLAGLPSRVVAQPVNQVALGSFAEAAGDRAALSADVNRTVRLLASGGFLTAGGLAVTAPDLVQLVLGEKWLPMVDVFRWMLVFSMLDPMRVALGHLLTGTGRARELLRVSGLQVLVLIALMVPLGRVWGPSGVASAVTASAAAGTAALFRAAHRHVELDLRQTLLRPTLTTAAGVLAAAGVAVLLDRTQPAVSGLSTIVVYATVAFATASWQVRRTQRRPAKRPTTPS